MYNLKCRNREKAGAQENCKIFRLAPCFLPFSSLNSGGSVLSEIKCKEVINVLKTKLEVVTVGAPDVTALSENEQRIFFETIAAKVLELAKERNLNETEM